MKIKIERDELASLIACASNLLRTTVAKPTFESEYYFYYCYLEEKIIYWKSNLLEMDTNSSTKFKQIKLF